VAQQFLFWTGHKITLKRQHAATLQQWRIGGGVAKNQFIAK